MTIFFKLPLNSRHLSITDKFFKTSRFLLFRGFTVISIIFYFFSKCLFSVIMTITVNSNYFHKLHFWIILHYLNFEFDLYHHYHYYFLSLHEFVIIITVMVSIIIAIITSSLLVLSLFVLSLLLLLLLFFLILLLLLLSLFLLFGNESILILFKQHHLPLPIRSELISELYLVWLFCCCFFLLLYLNCFHLLFFHACASPATNFLKLTHLLDQCI